jgi:hypothetical protein
MQAGIKSFVKDVLRVLAINLGADAVKQVVAPKAEAAYKKIKQKIESSKNKSVLENLVRDSEKRPESAPPETPTVDPTSTNPKT